MRRLLTDVGGYVEQWLVERHGERLKALLVGARDKLAAAGHAVPGARKPAPRGSPGLKTAVAATVTKPTVRPTTWTDRIDSILTHRLWGTLRLPRPSCS